MLRRSIACLTLAVPIFSFAEPVNDWALIASTTNAAMKYYVDFSTVRDVANIRKAWTLRTYSKPQKTTKGQAFRSTVAVELFNCDAQTNAVSQIHFYTQPDQQGNPFDTVEIPDPHFSDAPPNSIGDIVLREVCAPKRLNSPQ